MLRIVVPIKPKGQERVRHKTIIKGKSKISIAYKTKKQRESENELKLHMEKYRRNPLWSGAVCVHVECYFPRPKSHFRKTKGIEIIKKDAPDFHTNKPDADNILKHICDCGNGILWHDDKQVVEAIVEKFYTVVNEPRMVINVAEIA